MSDLVGNPEDRFSRDAAQLARGNCGVKIRLLPYFDQIYILYIAITCEEVSAI